MPPGRQESAWVWEELRQSGRSCAAGAVLRGQVSVGRACLRSTEQHWNKGAWKDPKFPAPRFKKRGQEEGERIVVQHLCYRHGQGPARGAGTVPGCSLAVGWGGKGRAETLAI